MKKLFKNKKVIGSLVTILLIGLGVDQVGLSPVVTEIICEKVSCVAA